MNERLRANEGEMTRFRVTEDQVLTDATETEYFMERIEAINAGEKVWMARNFDSDSGRVYDLYKNKKNEGFVHDDWNDHLRETYLWIPSEGRHRIIDTTDRSEVSLDDARRVLEEALEVRDSEGENGKE